ncbi:MAG: hypothetical protein AB7T86_10220 [Xanthobacteraceae bacterium]|uniref:hypothetical protein n=1 Tax=Pseudolabrys sp. TaxID=1960880 RepID=UPI003D149234
MRWGRSCRAHSAAVVFRVCGALAVAASLSACNTTGNQTASLAAMRGPSVAFESIDGPPPEVFQKLVARLNEEAQIRRLAVVSRQTPSAYRIRGYLAARVEAGRTAISWTWDVYDGEQRRATRITGAQSRAGKHKAADAWTVADDEMLKAIAGASLDQLAAFLAASDATPPAAPTATGAALTADASSPEAAGIFRIFQAKADPVDPSPDGPGAVAPEQTGTVPLPPSRPATGHQRIARPGGMALSARSR